MRWTRYGQYFKKLNLITEEITTVKHSAVNASYDHITADSGFKLFSRSEKS